MRGSFWKKLFMRLAGLVFLIWGVVVFAVFYGMHVDGEFAAGEKGLAMAMVIVIGGLPLLLGLVFLIKPIKNPDMTSAAQAEINRLKAALDAVTAAQNKSPTNSTTNLTDTGKKTVDSQNYFQ